MSHEISVRTGAASAETPAREPKPSMPRWMPAVLAAAIVAVLAGGAWFYRDQRLAARRSAESELGAIARLKAEEISAWRTKLLDEGRELMERRLLGDLIAGWLADPDGREPGTLLDELRVVRRHDGYRDIVLADPGGTPRLSLAGGKEPIHPEAAAVLAAALRDREPAIIDLHTGAYDPSPHISVVVPVLAAGDGGARSPAGSLILVCDARDFLYPLIRSWPTHSRTAETLLVRREGDDVLFLNDLRHRPDTALKLRIPLSRSEVPAVQGALGRQGTFEGLDYRGVDVVSVIVPIPRSPWIMVAKVDADEVFAGWRSRAAIIIALVVAVVSGMWALGLVVWQRRAKSHYRVLYLAESELRAGAERHAITLRSIGDAVIATDALGKVELLNPVAEELTGWPHAEARGRPLEDVFRIVNEETREAVESPVAKVLREGLVVGLANHTVLIARDGWERPVADSGAPIRDAAGAIIGVVLVFRDQTAEREVARELGRLNRELRALSDCNQALVRAKDEPSLLGDVCRIIHDVGGYPFVCVSMAMDDPCRTVRGAAQAGADQGYLDRADVTWADTERGQGPTGTAIRIGRPCVIQDTAHDPRYAPWREMAIARGFRASAAFPLLAEGKAFGALTVCSGAPDSFTEQEVAILEELASDIAYGVRSLRTAEALRARQTELQAVHDNVPVMTYLTDRDRRIVFANRESVAFAGVPEDRLVGQRVCGVLGCVHSAEDPRGCGFGPECPQCTLFRDISGTLSTGRPQRNVEHRMTRVRDGKPQVVILSASTTLLHPTGEARLLLCMEDVTERRRAEDELRRSRAFLDSIIEHSPYSTWISDEHGTLIRLNQVLRDTLHITDDDVVGRYNVLRDEQVEAQGLMPLVRQAFEEGKTVRFTIRYDGERLQRGPEKRPTDLILDVKMSPVLDSMGRLLHVVCQHVDITDRVRAEAATRESEARFRCLVDAAPEGVFVQSAGRFVFVNPAMVRLLGARTAEDLLGKDFLDRIAPEHHEAVRQRIRIQRETGQPVPGGVQEYLRLDGSRIRVETTATPIQYEGRAAHLVFVRDVTDRKRLEDQLRQAQKMEAVGQLAGGIAHDFRNQLTVIRGFADMLLRRSLVLPGGVDKLQEIVKAADRSTALTGQLLAFSRTQTLESRLVALTDLIADIGKALPRVIGEDIRLAIVPCREQCVVEIDPGQFQQALVNLVTNARDAMPGGGHLTIETSCRKLDPAFLAEHPYAIPGTYAAVAVTDTGCGMDEATRAKVFEPFFTTKEVGRGTGLGLAMVYGFVKQSGGIVEVESEPGKGSTFTMYFPVREGHDGSRGEGEDARKSLPGGTETILVVEDEDPVRAMLVESLREAGYAILEARCSAEALAEVGRSGSRIDLVITDVVMPGGSGVELVEAVRRVRPQIPVLYISGYAEKELSRRGMSIEAGHVLWKPCTQESLLTRARRLLDAAKGTLLAPDAAG